MRLDQVSAFYSLPSEQVAEHASLLVAADWLAEAVTAEDRLRARR
ncbi:hypothetical protein [Streptomyces acidicola]|nr:hypothetical protein [Streptomyces acidicola]